VILFRICVVKIVIFQEMKSVTVQMVHNVPVFV